MSKRSAHGTHIWIRTELVEAILHHQGNLPKNWKPSSSSSVSRRNGATEATDWGWARAQMSGTACPASSPENQQTGNQEETGNPFGSVKLRKTNHSPSIEETVEESNNEGPKMVSVTITIDDEEFAPRHLLYTPVPLTYDARDNSLVCTANSWWYSEGKEPPEDLTNLAHLHEPAVVFCLQRRYEQDQIYTYTGKVLLALNPFRPVQNVYGDNVMQQYWSRQLGHQRPPPHVYAVAEDAYRSLVRSLTQHSADPHHSKGQDQSILVSGESGAGKTVTTKIIMKYLATLSQNAERHSNGQHHSIEAQVLQSNPILESFGNARTIRNDNSSRFGKFIEIEFNSSGCLSSASIETYLLEKVRLITQASGERNYHIFYEILAGLSQRERQQLRIGNLNAQDFKMTAASGTFDRRDGVADRDTFKALREALDTVGFTRDEQFDLLRVSTALMHASNLCFQENTPDASELDLSNPSLRSAVDLLGVSVIALNEACCRFAIQARGETMYKNLTIEQAKKAVEALIKATYQALFTHIVQRINSFISVNNDLNGSRNHTHDTSAHIGVLDIFGFESFEENSFEQLCINFCNEALQQQFNKFVFKQEQDEYRKEGIDWSFVSFPDNQDVLDLIEQKRDGIISILDEQCRLPRCTDSSFARALYDKCSDHPRFVASNTQKVDLSFSIQHYAGLVEYSAANFLEKNKDELPKETTDLLMSSSYGFVAHLAQILSETASLKSHQQPNKSGTSSRALARSPSTRNNGSSMLRESVGSQFSSQLRELRNRIEDTAPHYIRCLKPNDDLIPYNFQPLIIADQLRCAGVLEAIRVSRVGFPHRYTHFEFINLYSLLCKTQLEKHGGCKDMKELCEVLVSFLIPLIQNVSDESSEPTKEKKQFDRGMMKGRSCFLGLQMGRSKVFIRPQTFEALEYLRIQKVERSAILMQSIARMFLSTIRFEISQIAVIIIQTQIRKFCAVRRTWRIRLYRRALAIQNVWRRFSSQRRLGAALMIAKWSQCAYRGAVARQQCMALLFERNARIIQRSWRRSQRNSGIRSLKSIRGGIVRFQAHCRRRQAKDLLKQLRAQERDLHCVAKERDQFREETRKLREELERAKREAETRGRMSKEHEVQQLKKEMEALKAELERAKQFSPTNSQQDEMGFLLRECELKELQLKGLRSELADWRTPNKQKPNDFHSPCSSEDSTVGAGESRDRPFPIQEIRQLPKSAVRIMKSPARSEVTSMSLLDADNPQDSYLDESFEAVLDMPPGQDLIAQTSATMSLSYSMNTPNLRGEAFFRELRHLHDAVRSGHLDRIEEVLTQSSEDPQVLINEGDEVGRTALHVAVLDSNFLVTKTLLEKGAISNAQDNDGETPLHLAETASVTNLLLKEGRANPNIPNIDGICALHLAVQRRDLDSVRALLLHNANVNSADNVRWFIPLHLIALPAKGGVEDGISEGDVRIRIAELMSGGATSRYEPDMNYQDSEGNCPLHYAAQLVSADAFELIKVFVQNGADPKVLNNRSQSALHLFCHNNSLRKFDFYQELLRTMLAHGADPNQQSAAGCTALHLSLYHRDIETAVTLVANGAQLNHPLWRKPKRWISFWDDKGSSSVLALDMVKDESSLVNILSAITQPQKWAPTRTWCMECKMTLGTFARALHCRHCGRFVCGDCCPRTLSSDYFPPDFEVDENSAWICVPCDKILVGRKECGLYSASFSSKKDDDCSSTQLVSSIHESPKGSMLAEF